MQVHGMKQTPLLGEMSILVFTRGSVDKKRNQTLWRRSR